MATKVKLRQRAISGNKIRFPAVLKTNTADKKPAVLKTRTTETGR